MTQNSPVYGHLTAVSFLELIKHETRDAHRKLESLPISRALLSPGITISDYRRYLAAMRGVNDQIEQDVFPLLAGHFSDLHTRRKGPWLDEDLRDETQSANSPVFALENRSEAFLAGILYTIEGSTLGGRFIMSNLTKLPGVTPGRGSRYFSGYGNETGAKWKRFLSELSPIALQHPEEVIAGAKHAFEAIYKHLQAA